MKGLSIKIKLLLTILAVTLAPLMVAGYFSYQSSYEGIYELTKKDLNYIVGLEQKLIDLELKNTTGSEQMDRIQEHVNNIDEEYFKSSEMDGYGFITTEEGVIVLHPDETLVGTSLADYSFMQEIINTKNGYIEYEFRGKEKVAAFKQLSNGNIFAVSNYLHDMMKPVEPIKRETFLISLFGSLVALMVGVFIVTQIIKPMKSVMFAMRKASEGDLTSEVPVKSGDEIGQMSEMFNKMIVKLKDILSNIQDASQQVAASSQELTASANESSKASEQTALAADDISRGSRKQVEQVADVVTSIHSISNAITHTANRVTIVKKDSDLANEHAITGAENIDEVIKEMNNITRKVRETEQVIFTLGDQSKSILGIITTITNISEQTNLLALNAAIEAARAGENGQSFAVVAGEVRKLAVQSRVAAEEITNLIHTINEEINNATVLMQESSKEVEQGEVVAKEAGKSFTDIKLSVNNVHQEMDELKGEIDEINEHSKQIVSYADEISKLAEQAAGDTEGVAAAAEEQLATMEEINAASQTLSEMADQLEEEITQFKV